MTFSKASKSESKRTIVHAKSAEGARQDEVVPGILRTGALLKRAERRTKTVPQRLKPDCESGTYGTAEAVPLSKTGVHQPVTRGLASAFEALGSMPEDFFAEGRVDDPPQDREEWC
jgi:hypothetical protein